MPTEIDAEITRISPLSGGRVTNVFRGKVLPSTNIAYVTLESQSGEQETLSIRRDAFDRAVALTASQKGDVPKIQVTIGVLPDASERPAEAITGRNFMIVPVKTLRKA